MESSLKRRPRGTARCCWSWWYGWALQGTQGALRKGSGWFHSHGLKAGRTFLSVVCFQKCANIHAHFHISVCVCSVCYCWPNFAKTRIVVWRPECTIILWRIDRGGNKLILIEKLTEAFQELKPDVCKANLKSFLTLSFISLPLWKSSVLLTISTVTYQGGFYIPYIQDSSLNKM